MKQTAEETRERIDRAKLTHHAWSERIETLRSWRPHWGEVQVWDALGDMISLAEEMREELWK